MPTARIKVSYKGAVAKFSDRDDAIDFARAKSRGGFTEVHAPDGIVGQFENGKATPEFEHLDQGVPAPNEPTTYGSILERARAEFQTRLQNAREGERSEDGIRQILDGAVLSVIPIYNNEILEILSGDLGLGFPDDKSIMEAEDIYEAARGSIRESLLDDMNGAVEAAIETAQDEEDEVGA